MKKHRTYLVIVVGLLILGIIGEFVILDFLLFNYERMTWWGRDASEHMTLYGITWPLIFGAIGFMVLITIGGIGIRNYFMKNL